MPRRRLSRPGCKGGKKSQTAPWPFDSTQPVGWVFKAGQFLDMTLLNPAETDAEGSTRSFSIASAPDEDTLMVATPYA